MRRGSVFQNEQIVGSPKVHYALLVAMMLGTWLVFSGHYNVKFVTMGVISAFVLGYLCMPIMYVKGNYSGKQYFVFGVNLFKYVLYWAWLLNEVRKASLDVAFAVMRQDMDVVPRFFSFKMNYDNPMAHATLANSITLTPGTVTMHVSEDGVYSIHALTNGAWEGLMDGGMQMKIKELFGDPGEYEAVEPADVIKEVM